ncbi:OmpA family protein [Flavobacterium sp. 102]|uniref:OmpA family protein n=1 Tax=Flavobacterium sp. 102 TaxID=2135623 RepID=UPI000EB167B1|nr:OmpA family protein [Flavobacterium sp. 102]RKS03537.1 outer membrane protein OmpA-like peptidoglycan-associated protein [Flavobacterium sp. 102]
MKKIYIILLFLPFFGFSQQSFEVFFDFNAAVPNQASLTKLNQWIKANKSAEITKVLGYCDSVDDSQYNIDLAVRRINSVLDLLKKDTIKISDKVELKPFGKDFKLSKNQEENRKVKLFFILKEEKKINPTNEEEEISFSSLSELVAKEKSELAQKFEKAKKGDLIRINNINFHFNSEKMMDQSEPLLLELLQILYDNPKLRIAIHGHICCNPNGMDTKLSYRRALVIFKYLTKFEIEVNRLSYKGFGSNDPIYKVPERNEAERKANRRVEILIVDK